MTTSGTIGTTKINNIKLLEKAVRRCGLTPSVLTPELMEQAKETMFMFMTSLSARGLNLWCVDEQLLAHRTGQAKYVLPVGTQDLLNVLQSVNSIVQGEDSSTATDFKSILPASASIVRYGVKFGTIIPTSFSLQKSMDGLVWTTIETVDSSSFAEGVVYWFKLDPAASAIQFRIHSTGQDVSRLYLVTSFRDVPMSPFNRDDYANQPDKNRQSSQILNYFFEKKIAPTITLWPVPNDETRCLSFFRYHQLEDVGSLVQELAIPTRWYDHVCWKLSAHLAFELPGVDPARRQEVKEMAASFQIEAESGEGDGAPVYYAPNIGVYTA